MKKQRNRNGFSIILVSSLGLILVLSAIAITSGLIPVYKSIGASSGSSEAQAAAELGVQYALSRLNLDPTDIPNPLPVPPGYSSAKISVQVEPLEVTTTAFTTSALYDSAVINFGSFDYRKITSTATLGNYKGSVIAIAKYSPLSKSLGSTPFFNNALFGADDLTVSADAGKALNIKSEGSALKASISSNHQINLIGRSVIDGNVIANNPKVYSSLDQDSVSVKGSSLNRINGNLIFNGGMQNNVSPSSPAFLTDSFSNFGRGTFNVLGDGISNPFRPVTGSISSVGPSQNELAPAPSVTASGAATYSSPMTVEAPPVGQTANLGDVNLSGSQTLVLPPGNYVASSLTIEGNAKITVPSGDNGASSLKITVQGETSFDPPISIKGNGIQLSGGADASALQIFYAGRQSVEVQPNSTFRGLVYAPNAGVSIALNGQDFHGAATGKSLGLSGWGNFYYNPALSNPGSSPATSSLYYSKNDSSKGAYTLASWYEPSIK